MLFKGTFSSITIIWSDTIPDVNTYKSRSRVEKQGAIRRTNYRISLTADSAVIDL